MRHIRVAIAAIDDVLYEVRGEIDGKVFIVLTRCAVFYVRAGAQETVEHRASKK